MAQESREIGERIGAVEFAGGNEAHKEIPHPCSSKGLEEQRVLSMEDALFEHPLANVVVQGSVENPQKECESRPVIEHVLYGFAHAGVGFNGFFRELVFQPFLEVVHEGAAVFLVEGEPLFAREHLCLGKIIEMIDTSEDADDMLGLFGKGG
jgi:hypothetical protein